MGPVAGGAHQGVEHKVVWAVAAVAAGNHQRQTAETKPKADEPRVVRGPRPTVPFGGRRGRSLEMALHLGGATSEGAVGGTITGLSKA